MPHLTTYTTLGLLYNQGKQVKGRKHHLIVDSQGLLLNVVVTEANMPDRLGAIVGLLETPEDNLSELVVIWIEQGYSEEKFAQAVLQVCRARVKVIKRTEA